MKEIKITVNGKSYEVKVGDISASPVEIVVDGKSYQVEYDAPTTNSAPVRSAPVVAAPVFSAPVTTVSAPSPVAASGSGVRAPMPGTIVKIDVKPGDKVTRGQQLVSLEAMKMKNSIKSPADGVVKAIHVTDGQKVQFNDVLVSFE